jgi:hypothetical protein
LGLKTWLDKNGLALTSSACRLFPYPHCHRCGATDLAKGQVQDPEESKPPLLTAVAARSFYNNPNGGGSMSPPSQPIPGRPVPLSDCLRTVAGAARRPALFPQLFPIPHPGRQLVRQWESELMREHTHLAAMVGFVREHVAQHFHANRPRRSPAVSAKLLDAARTLCMCVKIAAMVRALPGGLALQGVASRCSMRIWFMRSLAAKIWTAARPS